MSSATGEAGRLVAAARLALDQTHALLLEPTARNVEIASASLCRAIGNIEALQNCLAERREPAAAGLAESASGLRRGIADIALLLDHAATYHANLLRTMVEANRPPVVPISSIGMGRRVQLHA